MENLSVGDFLLTARLEKGLTQKQLAFRVGHSDSYIARIESGKQRGSFQTLSKMAEALNLPVDLVLRKAGLSNIGFVSFDDIRHSTEIDLETYEFSKLDPKVKKVLLRIAHVIKTELAP